MRINQRILFSTLFFWILTIFIAVAQTSTDIILEAETGKLSGEANIVACSRASGGEMVRGISSDRANALEFVEINVPTTAKYFITLSYLYTSDRTFTYEVNGGVPQSHDILASGEWCYLGGGTRDFIFEQTLEEGDNRMLFYSSPIIDKIRIVSDTAARKSSTFYISSADGDDTQDGRTPDSAWRSIEKINALDIVPGDSVLFKQGETYIGRLTIRDEGGTPDEPIFIGTYGNGGKPIIDGDGYLSSIHIINSGNLHISGLEIKNDGGPAQPGEPTNLRYGIYVENTYSDGTTFDHFRFDDLTFKNIYPTDQITDNDQTGTHAYAFNTSGSWGDAENPTRFNDIRIEKCLFTRTGRHALRIVATNDLYIRNNLFEHVGGAGMVIGANSSNILIEHNTTNYTGSSIDSRMAGRGSGVWCFRTKNLTVQHNRFMHARGIKDSFGMHIDIGNKNVVYQYNYSEDNEGGFAEILGGNINVGYRYNLSIGDGWRARGSQLGRIFWIGGWSGTPNAPIASDSVFIYNNSIFVRDTISPRIWIEAITGRTRIYNNIVYAPNGLAEVFIKNPSFNNDFDHNLWYGSIPMSDTDGESYRGSNAMTSNPLFIATNVTDSIDFVLQSNSPALGTGKIIYPGGEPSPFDYYSKHGGRDYYGHPVSNTDAPNIGAYNWVGDVISDLDAQDLNTLLEIYPNPVQRGKAITLRLPDNLKSSSITIEVIDIQGRVIETTTHRFSEKIEIETENISNGVYLLTIAANEVLISKQVWVYE